MADFTAAPAYSNGKKRLFQFVAFAPVVVFGGAMVVDALVREQGAQSPPGVVAMVAVALVLWLIGMIWAITHVSRREDITSQSRSRWLAGTLLFFPIALPLVWSNLIRELPRQEAATAGSAP
ncbi:hypothetical protein HJD18_13630 [Thermoleophilia bacterium SCSIO 60948]|nr:hypothetical protein HJD18_13630 [Thermoleophilia bacterium SCSIO 60948]